MNMIKYARNKRRMSTGMSDKAFNVIVLTIVTVFLVMVLYPLIYVISSSFSSGSAVTGGRVILWPVEFTLAGYQLVFSNTAIWRGYANTIFFTVVRTVVVMIHTTLVAYVLSRRDFQGRKFFNLLYLFTMWFSGGMIPTYILKSSLGMVNSRWAYCVTGVAVGYMVIMRTYFRSSIPGELFEAGKMDGIDDFSYLFKIVIPLSKPVMSVIALYTVVGNWNDYFGPLIYLRDKELQTLQLVLRRILNAAQIDTSDMVDASLLANLVDMADSMKYSLIVVSTVPMLMLFPFVQKFFKQGVLLGSLKG